MNKGWISIHRKIFDNIILKPKGKYTRLEAWLWLLKETSYSDQKVNIGNEIYNVKSGQILRSQEKLRKQFKWGNTKLLNFFKLLQKEEMISVKTNSKTTMITILKFNELQKRQTENKYQTNIKQIHINKDNKDNKVYNTELVFKNKCKELIGKHELLEQFIDYWTEKNLSGKKMKFQMQKTFDIKRRFARWCNNAKDWNIKPKQETLDDKFPLDKTGNARLGVCSKCRSTVFLDKWKPILDSICCNAKVIGKAK